MVDDIYIYIYTDICIQRENGLFIVRITIYYIINILLTMYLHGEHIIQDVIFKCLLLKLEHLVFYLSDFFKESNTVLYFFF